jgi:hypothetical protein
MEEPARASTVAKQVLRQRRQKTRLASNAGSGKGVSPGARPAREHGAK